MSAPDIPASSLAAAEEAIIRAASDFSQDGAGERSSRKLARAALDAAAPLLAEAWGVTGTRKPATTRDLRAQITCRRCGAGPGLQCVTSSGTRAPGVHAERRNDWRRAEGTPSSMLEAEGMHMDRLPPRAAPSSSPEVPGAEPW